MSVPHDQLVTLTADIVAAYVGKHNIRPSELSQVIADVHAALVNLDKVPEPEAPVEKLKPPVSIKKSIQDDCLVCLEDGLKFKSLKRHLMTHHQLTPEQYRDKWGLAEDYPMVAPAYAAKRSQVAKDSGLGQQRKKADPS